MILCVHVLINQFIIIIIIIIIIITIKKENVRVAIVLYCVIVCFQDVSLPKIFKLFRGIGLRHLVVVNDRNMVR